MYLTKLRPRDIKPLRQQLFEQQLGICALCGEHMDPFEAVLDHCHTTGFIRSVVHRGCNAFIGHMENNQRRNLITPARLTAILNNFSQYVIAYKHIVHPTHLTPEERQARSKKRAKARRKKPK